ncbi:hypothetical protein MJM04_33285, partial [Salmonella enterica subsp. enterica serovar Cerro]|nr:hypothetical protein [Salmonella enterica subsp. enterica serovar Cerro]
MKWFNTLSHNHWLEQETDRIFNFGKNAVVPTGFGWLGNKMKGTVDRAEMHYIIRDFDRKQFEARKRKMMEIAKKVGKGLHP